MHLAQHPNRRPRKVLARLRWSLPLLSAGAALALLLFAPFQSGIGNLHGAEPLAATDQVKADDAATEKEDPEEADEAEEAEEDAVWVAGVPIEYDRRPVRPFEVRSRKEVLDLYPCADCHEDELANPRERKLVEEHEDIVLDHGGERFWCLTCHGSKDKNTLSSLKGQPIDFDQSYLLCGQCHSQRQKDWFYGGHGKSLAGWRGLRRIAICTECHAAHSPSIKPFIPAPPPLVRKGLIRREFKKELHRKPWDGRVPEDGKKKGEHQ